MLHLIVRLVLLVIAGTTFVLTMHLVGDGLAGVAVGFLAAVGALSLIGAAFDKVRDGEDRA